MALVKAGQIAELAGAELKRSSSAMPARVAVSERREQQRARMRRHVQPVRDQRDRTEQQAAGDLSEHHGRAQRDHHPGAAFVALVACAEKDMRVKIARDAVRHNPVLRYCRRARRSLEIGLDRLDQLFGAAAFIRIARRIDDMKPDVVLDHLGHQARERTARGETLSRCSTLAQPFSSSSARSRPPRSGRAPASTRFQEFELLAHGVGQG